MASQIGDALGMPRQFYYDKVAFDKDTPEGIQHYMDPLSSGNNYWDKINKLRHQNGIRAGMVTQNTQLARILIKSITDKRDFNLQHFLRRLDSFTSGLKADAYQGRFTTKLVRDIIKYRQKSSWPQEGMSGISNAESGEGAQMMAVLATLYRNPVDLVRNGQPFLQVLYQSDMLIAMQLAYGLTVQALVNGIALAELKYYLASLHSLAIIKQAIPNPDTLVGACTGEAAWLPSDALPTQEPSTITRLYGRGNSFYQLQPAAYFFAFSAHNQVENALLSAANSLGNNSDCAFLTGALSGALSGIEPLKAWLLELEEGALYLDLAEKISDLRKGKSITFVLASEDFTTPIITPLSEE